MARTIAPIYLREASLPVQGIGATYSACPARTPRGKNDRSVAHSAEDFLAKAPAIRTRPGRHSAVCCHATGHQSPYNSFTLGQIDKCPPPSVPLTFSVVYLQVTTDHFSLRPLFLSITVISFPLSDCMSKTTQPQI